MEELDLKELFDIFWNKRLQVILIVLIFMVIGIIYTIGFVTPIYSSSASLILASSGTATTGENSNAITTTDLTINSKLVSTYSELVKRKSILTEVINNLGIDVNVNSLRNNVSVNTVKESDLIEITVKDENPTYAAKIANEITKVFSEKVKAIYNIENVQVIDEAEIQTSPSNINHVRDVAIFLFIGLVVAIAYILILNMLDTTVKAAEDIEKLFDTIPVLVSIPVYGALQETKGKSKSKGGRR